ncbi:alpha/beta fold hydrolase [Gordonia sp. X0973]|uniref:alpha/beta fold hydrolase n=1 Tax=Gordonia sp. X0973 TaxID=2742602 RepID=UPI000F5323B4|nr:alpha/beta fold hydrolase [Gordonia sp. X0973]QKT09079.1 alpha/beta fold hydrolase [Gordonia sp. X0973]
MSEPSHDPAAYAEQERFVTVGGQRLRVRFRRGQGVPLVLCNGIGAALETFDPLVAEFDPTRPLVRFDAPGVGESSVSPLPYGFPYLAWVLGKLLDKLDIDTVDVLGYSWGGALAQQFAFQNPKRCRRLVLMATGTGALMVPGSPMVLRKMLTPRRYRDPDYAAQIAGDLYGGAVRGKGGAVADVIGHAMHNNSRRGYVHQLAAGSIWTSLHGLPFLRQPTLVIAGEDDPIIPLVNARIMQRLLPNATVYRHPGGHVDPIIVPAPFAHRIDAFLSS